MIFAAQKCPCYSHCVLCPKWRWEGLPTMHNIILWIETVAEFRMASSVPPETTPAAGGFKEMSRIISHPCRWNNQSRLNDLNAMLWMASASHEPRKWTRKKMFTYPFFVIPASNIDPCIPVTNNVSTVTPKRWVVPRGLRRWRDHFQASGLIPSRCWVLSFRCEGQSGRSSWQLGIAWQSLAAHYLSQVVILSDQSYGAPFGCWLNHFLHNILRRRKQKAKTKNVFNLPWCLDLICLFGPINKLSLLRCAWLTSDLPNRSEVLL